MMSFCESCDRSEDVGGVNARPPAGSRVRPQRFATCFANDPGSSYLIFGAVSGRNVPLWSVLSQLKKKNMEIKHSLDAFREISRDVVVQRDCVC